MENPSPINNGKSGGSILQREQELLKINELQKIQQQLAELKKQQQQLHQEEQQLEEIKLHLEQELQNQDAAAGSTEDSRYRAYLSLEDDMPQVKESGSEQQLVDKQQLKEENLQLNELQLGEEPGSCSTMDGMERHKEVSSLSLREGNNNVQSVPTATLKKYRKTTGHADMSGELYEVKVATLLFGRALNRAEDFHLASNMAAARAFDDITLKLGQRTMFLQLKHRTNRGKTIYRSHLVQLKGDFSLLKYYKSYCEIKQCWAQDKDLQHFGRFEDCVFIVYTNATIDTGIVNDVGNTDEWYNILSTGEKCQCFTGKSLPDVYELFLKLPRYIKLLSGEVSCQPHEDLLQIVRELWNNKATELPNQEELNRMLYELKSIGDVSDHGEFLSQLRFCTGQAAEKKLDDVIRQELKTAFGKDIVYDKFLAGVQKWWKYSNNFLTITAHFLLEILETCAANISEPKLKQLDSINLSFRKCAVERMKEVLPHVGGFLHIVSKLGTTALTTLKLRQSLAGERYLLVDGKILCAHQSEVLTLWGRWYDLLVVVDDGETSSDFLQPHPGKRLVYISESASDSACTVILHDEPDLRQLDDASQAQVLDSQVKFQGYDVALGEIIGCNLDLVPADVIVQLLTDKPMVGNNLTSDIDYYVARTLRLSARVTDKILSHRITDSPVTLAVSGLSHSLQPLPSGREIHTIDKQAHEDEGFKVKIISTENDFLKLTESCETVHWLHREGNVFMWKQSRGDMSILIKYLMGETCQFENVDSVMDISRSVTLVSAEPGMGKSTLLTHLALATKRKHPAMWVVRVNLNAFTQQLEKLPHNLDLQDTVNFLLQVSGITEEWSLMFRCKLETMENVCVMFDGYDEISPTHSDKVAKILRILKGTKLPKLWVTTRTVMKEKLEHELSTLAFTLQPFSDSDQQNFLAKFWKKSVPQIQEPLLNKFITELLHLTATNLNDRDREFMGIPLQSMLMADAFEKDLRTYSETGEMELPHKFDLLQLYNKFVDRKLEIYYDKNKVDMTNPGHIEVYNQWKHTVQENHIICAVMVLLPDIREFHDSKSLMDKFNTFILNIKRGQDQIGIIQDIVNSKPVFIHRTFAEYFAALWFERNFENMESSLKEKLFDPNFLIVSNFFNQILAQNFLLHVAVLNENKILVKTLLSKPQQDVNEKDKGGRTALHLALMGHVGTRGDDSSNSTLQQIITILLEHGADPGIEDKVLSWRPIRLAEKVKAWSAVDMLLGRQADSSDLVLTKQKIHDNDIHNILIVAARQGLVQLVTFIMHCGLHVEHPITMEYKKENCKVRLLHEAARHGQLGLVKFLLDKKADTKAQDSGYERTALMWAAGEGHLQVVELLMQRGASDSLRDRYGNTALLVAARNEKWNVCTLLSQQQDVDVTACDNNGYNALHYAARLGAAELVALLLDTSQFHVDCCTNRNQTALWLAAMYGQMEVIQLLCGRSADLNVQDTALGRTPLHAATETGNEQVVECLVQHGASPTACDRKGCTPLHVAAWWGHLQVVQYLLDHDASPTACDQWGYTSLHAAAERGHLQVVELLVQSGANPNAHNSDGHTPLVLAEKRGRSDVAEFLRPLTQ